MLRLKVVLTLAVLQILLAAGQLLASAPWNFVSKPGYELVTVSGKSKLFVHNRKQGLSAGCEKQLLSNPAMTGVQVEILDIKAAQLIARSSVQHISVSGDVKPGAIAALSRSGSLRKVEFLYSSKYQPTRDDFGHFAKLKLLRALILPAGIADNAVPLLADLKKLTHLELLQISKSPGAFLLALSELSQLETLHLRFEQVTTSFDARVQHSLQRLTKLKVFTAGAGAAADLTAVITPLLNSRNLERLSFDNCIITREITAGLRHLPQLHSLSIRGGSLVDEQISDIVACQNLQTLDLNCSGLERPTGSPLHRLKKLKNLSISNPSTQVTKALAQSESIQSLSITFAKPGEFYGAPWGKYPLTAAHVMAIGEMTSLKQLSITASYLGRDLLAPLNTLPELKDLRITCNSAVSTLAGDCPDLLARLESLDVSTEALGKLKTRLPALQNLGLWEKYFHYCTQPAAANRVVINLPALLDSAQNLRNIHLFDCTVDAKTFSKLPDLQNLRKFHMFSGTVKGDLPAISSIERLEILEIDGIKGKHSKKVFAALMKASPNIRYSHCTPYKDPGKFDLQEFNLQQEQSAARDDLTLKLFAPRTTAAD